MSSYFEHNELEFDVDRKELAQIKQQFAELNGIRLARAMSLFSERQQTVLGVLPLLFHVNHPMLPGYISHSVPADIDGFTPSKKQFQYATQLAKSFQYQRDLQDRRSAIAALFAMGSLGTLAQTEGSDIDVWVCYNDYLSEEALQQLNAKCELIARWAEDFAHIEMHFFLMHATEFKNGKAVSFTAEASGSTQHYLLLDEFYRSAVWLAGRLPLWYFVPPEHEMEYSLYTRFLLSRRFLVEQDVIDFGGLPKIPASEFVGAAVWQLYKGVASPYKSVLKLLLIESYANNGASKPLSFTAKQVFYSALRAREVPSADKLDGYLLVYRHLENYLIAHRQLSRLELIRRCFYFKVGRQLSKRNRHSPLNWQKQLMLSLVTEWGWDQHQLTMLDNRAYWKSPHVLNERNLLANELSQAYRLLVEQTKSLVETPTFHGEEIQVLGRKLHAAFERKAGKIEFINPGISQDIGEPALYFVEVQEAGTSLWQVFRGSQQDNDFRQQKTEPIKRGRHFFELFLWCQANTILTAQTKVDISSETFEFSISQRQQLFQLLHLWLKNSLPEAGALEPFYHTARVQKVLLLINMGSEPQTELNKKGLQLLSSQKDALCYGGLHENLVKTIDIVHVNNWGEVVYRRFDEEPLVNTLMYFFRLPSSSAVGLPSLQIKAVGQRLTGAIEQRLQQLWRSITQCFFATYPQKNARYIFQVGGAYVLLHWRQQQPQMTAVPSYERLLEKLSAPVQTFSPIVIDEFALEDKPLRQISALLVPTAVSLIFERRASQVLLVLVDYRGVFYQRHLSLNHPLLMLRSFCRFIRAALHRLGLETSPDHLPFSSSFIDLKTYEQTYDASHKKYHLDERHISGDVQQVGYVNLYAVAEPDSQGGLQFSLYCDGKEFSTLEYGDGVYREVTQYLLKFRQAGEQYPCYITDLDLSLVVDFIAPPSGLQLTHYLQIKDEIETRLNVGV